MSEKPLYKKVVVGYPDDPGGRDALALGEQLAAAAGAELDKIEVEHGSVAKALHELAERGEADLIVLGSTHRAGLGRVTPGSVAEHLLRGARCRLAIAPEGFALRDDHERLRVIAVGYDGSPEAQVALEEAAALAGIEAASMRVIAVSAPAPPNLPGLPAADPAVVAGDLQPRLHDAVAELPSELRALPVNEKGDPAAKLLERAEEGVDLLVLGSRGFGSVLRLMLGSVSGRVIRGAPCPVMVVPRPG